MKMPKFFKRDGWQMPAGLSTAKIEELGSQLADGFFEMEPEAKARAKEHDMVYLMFVDLRVKSAEELKVSMAPLVEALLLVNDGLAYAPYVSVHPSGLIQSHVWQNGQMVVAETKK